MTRAERLKQAHAALLLGFADGCRRAKRYDEAVAFDKAAFEIWPKIDMDIANEEVTLANKTALVDLYSIGTNHGEFAPDDAKVRV